MSDTTPQAAIEAAKTVAFSIKAGVEDPNGEAATMASFILAHAAEIRAMGGAREGRPVFQIVQEPWAGQLQADAMIKSQWEMIQRWQADYARLQLCRQQDHERHEDDLRAVHNEYQERIRALNAAPAAPAKGLFEGGEFIQMFMDHRGIEHLCEKCDGRGFIYTPTRFTGDLIRMRCKTCNGSGDSLAPWAVPSPPEGVEG